MLGAVKVFSSTVPPPGARGLHRFANPGRFLRLAGRVLPWASVLGLALAAIGLYWGLFIAPADWQQGDAVRIMYVHVPAAWLASAGYMALAGASAASLVWRHPLADLAAVEIAPVGAGFTAICLITGSLWGKPMWGAYWVWDARLTSVLAVLGDVVDREIGDQARPEESRESDRERHHLAEREPRRARHQHSIPPRRADQRQDRLCGRQNDRERQREMAEFGNHLRPFIRRSWSRARCSRLRPAAAGPLAAANGRFSSAPRPLPSAYRSRHAWRAPRRR